MLVYRLFCKSFRKFTKWHTSSQNLKVGDLVLLNEDWMIPTKWPIGRVISGKDDVVQVVSIKTATGIYKRPAAKVALLLSD